MSKSEKTPAWTPTSHQVGPELDAIEGERLSPKVTAATSLSWRSLT